jgi:hypothetical protein
MSQENVEQQYRAADAFSRHDLDAFLAICDPEIELVSRHLTQWRSGKAIWWRVVLNETDALEVAGLRRAIAPKGT